MRGRLGRFVLFGLFVVVASPPVSAKDDPFGKERQGRLSDGLSRLSDAAERGERVTPRRFRGLSADGLEVRAVAELTDPDRRLAVEARVKALGGTVEGAAGALVRVALPVRGLRTLAADPGVRIVREPFRPSAKAVTSEGAAAIHAPEFRARTGADGAGVRIAVLDAGFARARDLVGEELPEGVLATDFVLERLDSFEEVHGTACAEIVHDVAPGAELVLAGFEDEVGWAEEIDRLVGGGVRIISHSIGFDNLYPPDGNNYFTQRVDQAQAAGVLFVTAAGNETGNYYQGSWRDTNSNNLLEFGPGTELLPIGAAAGGTTVALRWDDGFGASSHDYDLLVVTPAFLDDPRLSQDNPAIVAFSAGLQDGDDDPREVVDLEVDEDQILYAVIVHDPASPLLSSQRFWLYASAGVEPSFAAGTGTLSLPGDARGAVTVGAIAFDAIGVEGFSSRGPTADGRVKPDVAGPDRVTTAAYEGEPFPGTSAATPHVAGAAALILSRSPGLSVAALRAALEQATTTLGRTKNNDVGYGLIDLNQVR